MNDIQVKRVQSASFWEGFDLESKEQFSDFLHCGFSALYSDQEKEKIKLIKPKYNEDTQIFLIVSVNGEIAARSFSEQSNKDTLFMCMKTPFYNT